MARFATASSMLVLAISAVSAQAQPLQARLDAERRSAPVTRYEYGMFIEPIGGLVARTLWAEMLDDRKFYYPVVSAAHDVAPPPNAEGRPGVSYRKWRPLGGDDVVTMDLRDPYAGAQSPSVAVDAATPRGLFQEGITVARSKRYVGSLWLSGDAGARVQVRLVWGQRSGDSQAVTLPAPAAGWQRVTFAFTPGADTDTARFEITGTGSGRFRVAAVSLMPDDNVDGWRTDTIALAKSLNSGFWRLPGGNFLSDWDWHEAIGPRDKRPPMFDHAWSAMQTNDQGMDEWMTLARLVGVEPYVTVNAGLGDANSAAEQVEYLNGAATSEWGAKRAANGHPEPYGVRFWNIGNEPYGWWQIGRTTLDYFMIKHNEFARSMRAKDPTIVLIGSGAMPDQMHPKGTQENPTLASIQHKFGTEEDWTGGLFAKAWGNFDGVSEHWYDRAEQRPAAPADAELLEYVRSPSNQVRMKAEEWKIYEQRFPAMRERKIFLSIDEYAYFGPPTLKNALAYSMVLQEMLRHTDFLTMSAFTTGASTMDITPTASTLNATGMVFKLYGTHFGTGTVPIALDGNVPQPDPKHVVGYSHPQVKAGSATWPLDMIAGLSADGRTLKIAVVNATVKPQTVAISLAGVKTRGAGRRWLLTGTSLAAENKVGAPAGVDIRETAVPALGRSLIVPATATAVYEFPVIK